MGIVGAVRKIGMGQNVTRIEVKLNLPKNKNKKKL